VGLEHFLTVAATRAAGVREAVKKPRGRPPCGAQQRTATFLNRSSLAAAGFVDNGMLAVAGLLGCESATCAAGAAAREGGATGIGSVGEASPGSAAGGTCGKAASFAARTGPVGGACGTGAAGCIDTIHRFMSCIESAAKAAVVPSVAMASNRLRRRPDFGGKHLRRAKMHQIYHFYEIFPTAKRLRLHYNRTYSTSETIIDRTSHPPFWTLRERREGLNSQRHFSQVSPKELFRILK